MDTLFALIFGLIFWFIQFIPTILFFLIYLRIKKKGYSKIGLSILSIVFIWNIYSVYTAFYPTESFYKDEFENYTGINFPPSAQILTKESCYPDMHGDYSASLIFKTHVNDFNHILKEIQKNNKFEPFETPVEIFVPFKAIKDTNNLKNFSLKSNESDLTFILIFNEKENLIEMYRDSW